MSREERIVERRNQPHEPRYYGDVGPGYPTCASGDSWWQAHYADMVERRVVTRRPWGHSEVRYTPRSIPLLVLARTMRAAAIRSALARSNKPEFVELPPRHAMSRHVSLFQPRRGGTRKRGA